MSEEQLRKQYEEEKALHDKSEEERISRAQYETEKAAYESSSSAEVPSEKPDEFSAIKKELTPAIAGVGARSAGEAIRRGVGSDLVSNFAEDMAFRAAGGQSSSQGLDLIKEQAVSRGIKGASPITAVEPLVSPRKVGRAVLDEKLLGTLGLGTNEGNLSRAIQSSIEASKPTNDLLQTLTSPISKQDIYDRTGNILDIGNLDEAVPENKMVRKALEKRQDDMLGFQLPSEAEETKRQLQKSVNYGSDKGAAKATVSKAQARATREAVEQAADLAGKLDEFKALKGKSGNIQVASDIIESQLKPKTEKGLISGMSGMIGDIVTKKAPGSLAALSDMVNKFAKTKAAKFGTAALGGAVALGTSMLSEAADLTPSGPTSSMVEQRSQVPFAPEEYAPYWESKGMSTEEGVQKARLLGFKEGMEPAPSMGMDNGTFSAEKYAKDKRYQEMAAGDETDNYVQPSLESNYVEQKPGEDINAFNKPSSSKPSIKEIQFNSTNGPEMTKMADAMDASGDKAAQEYSRVLRQVISSPDSKKEAVLFTLNQQPAFRALVKKMKEGQ